MVHAYAPLTSELEAPEPRIHEHEASLRPVCATSNLVLQNQTTKTHLVKAVILKDAMSSQVCKRYVLKTTNQNLKWAKDLDTAPNKMVNVLKEQCLTPSNATGEMPVRTARHRCTLTRTLSLKHWQHRMLVRTWDSRSTASLGDSLAASYKFLQL